MDHVLREMRDINRSPRAQVMTFDGWVDHLMREMLDSAIDDWFRVCP